MKKKSNKETILLVGPYPPPYHGPSISFWLFYDFLRKRMCSNTTLHMVNTQSGDKSIVSIFNPSVIIKILMVLVRIIANALLADKIIIFGTQRFITVVGSIVAFIFCRLGKKVSIRVFGGAYDLYYFGRSILVRAIIRNALKLCSHIVVQTELTASSLYNIFGKRLRIIPNYRVPIANINYKSKASAKNVSFIYTGRIHPSKGCKELLKAFLELKKRLLRHNLEIHISLDLFGHIYDKLWSRKDLDIMQNDPNITFHGHVGHEAIIKAYSEADIFVLPSYWFGEGHPGSIIEAMMWGIPVIATRWRSIPEIVKHGVNGLVCTPKDIGSLADCMERLTLDSNFRLKLGRGALETSKIFDVNIICNKLIKILNI